MPRPKVKKVVTAKPASRQELPSNAESASIPAPAMGAAAATRRDAVLSLPVKSTRNTRPTRTAITASARSTRSGIDRAAQHVTEAAPLGHAQEQGTENTEEIDITETLVQATQDEVEVLDTTPPASGRRSKRLRNDVDQPTRRALKQASVEATQKSQSRIPSSPPAQPIAPASAVRVHNTPSYLTNFRRQPRQPSILNMVQQTVGLGASDDEDLSLEGETDLLGETTNVTEVLVGREGADAEGLYDDDVPTVLSSSSRKRKAAELETDGHDLEQTSKPTTPLHRRDATDLPSDPADLTKTIETASDGIEDDADDLLPDDSASHKAPRSSPPLRDNQQSEGLPSPRAKSRRPRRPGRVMKRRSSGRAVAQDNPSSSSAISASPPHSTPPSSPVNTQNQTAKAKAKAATTTRKGAKRDKTITLTTAALQALLPQTRKLKSDRVHDTFDIHSSSTPEEEEDEEVDEDEDELSRPRRRAAAPSNRVQKAGALKSPKATRGKAASRPIMAKATKANKASKARAHAPAAKAPTAKTSRTYTRRSQGDKENEGDDAEEQHVQDEDNSDVTVVDEGKAKSGELKDARAKFEEIDNWEMEFESADITGGSSPWR